MSGRYLESIWKVSERLLKKNFNCKEPDAFGQSGDEIVVRLLIPMGHYKAGAKKFQAWVNM